MTITLFIVIISLLLIHEMDAIRTKEWKMFIILKDISNELAYKIFTFVHLPLYFIAIFVMVQGGVSANAILYFVIDFFLIGHSIIHFCFRKKPNNGFTSTFSKTIIYSLSILVPGVHTMEEAIRYNS